LNHNELFLCYARLYSCPTGVGKTVSRGRVGADGKSTRLGFRLYWVSHCS